MALNESKNSHKDIIDSIQNTNNNRLHSEEKLNTSKHSKLSLDRKVEFNNRIEFSGNNEIKEQFDKKENGDNEIFNKQVDEGIHKKKGNDKGKHFV